MIQIYDFGCLSHSPSSKNFKTLKRGNYQSWNILPAGQLWASDLAGRPILGICLADGSALCSAWPQATFPLWDTLDHCIVVSIYGASCAYMVMRAASSFIGKAMCLKRDRAFFYKYETLRDRSGQLTSYISRAVLFISTTDHSVRR